MDGFHLEPIFSFPTFYLSNISFSISVNLCDNGLGIKFEAPWGPRETFRQPPNMDFCKFFFFQYLVHHYCAFVRFRPKFVRHPFHIYIDNIFHVWKNQFFFFWHFASLPKLNYCTFFFCQYLVRHKCELVRHPFKWNSKLLVFCISWFSKLSQTFSMCLVIVRAKSGSSSNLFTFSGQISPA